MSNLGWPLAGALVVVAGFLGTGRLRGVMLAWYLRESRKLELAERPRDAIKTYPMF